MRLKLAAMLVWGGTLALAQSDPELLFSECSDSSEVKRVVQSSDVVVVRHSLAGDAQTCYAVSIAAGNGKVVDGFLLGASHPAVLAFERKEEDYIAQVLPGQVFPNPAGATPRNQPKPVLRPKPHYSHKLWNPFSTRASAK
jgi:hypothetical protein